MLITYREKCCMRTSEAEWHAESLRIAKSNVCTELSRWCEKRKSKKVGGYRKRALQLVHFVRQRSEVLNTA